MLQLAVQELDDGVGQALPVVHLEAAAVTLLRICRHSPSVMASKQSLPSTLWQVGTPWHGTTDLSATRL